MKNLQISTQKEKGFGKTSESKEGPCFIILLTYIKDKDDGGDILHSNIEITNTRQTKVVRSCLMSLVKIKHDALTIR